MVDNNENSTLGKVESKNPEKPLGNMLREQLQTPEVSSALQRLGAEKVLLFGSQARGNATPESDIDVLVFFTGTHDAFIDGDRKKAIEIYLKQLLNKLGIPTNSRINGMKGEETGPGELDLYVFPASVQENPQWFLQNEEQSQLWSSS